MEDENTVRLLVNGREFMGWKDVSITLGIQQQARSFSLSVTRSWPGQSRLDRQIIPGDICQLFIGDTLVLTGYIDAAPVSYNATSITMKVEGRSKTADLVDCAAEGHQWRNRRVEDILADLARPYGIDVICSIDTGEPVSDHQIQQGEKAFESLDRLLKLRSLLATDNAKGEVVLTRTGTNKAETSLVLGDNILTGSAKLDFKQRYSLYTFKGQRAGTDAKNGKNATEMKAVVPDGEIRRYRPLIVIPEGQVSPEICEFQAQWEKAYRVGQSWEATYLVQGWRQKLQGPLWDANQQVEINDPLIGFNPQDQGEKKELLISTVKYDLSDKGMTTTLTVAPKSMYELNPYKKEEKKQEKKEEGKGDQNEKDKKPK